MKTSESDWTEFPAELIDFVVLTLKALHRWHIDGRSLSGVNRHWRHHLKTHIQIVHPHKSRILTPLDVAFLKTFQSVTALSPRSFFLFSGGNVQSVLRAMTELPCLTHLDADPYDVRNAFSEAIRLTGMTSVRLLRRWPEDAFRGTSLTALWSLPIKKLEIECRVIGLDAFLDGFQSLGELSIVQPVSNLSLLMTPSCRHLERLKMHYSGETPSELTSLTSLVSLSIRLSEDFLTIFPRLVQLKDVELMVPSDQYHLLSNATLWKKLQSIEMLSLKGEVGLKDFRPLMPLDLRRLELRKCRFHGNEFDVGHRLTTLSLSCCCILESDHMIDRFRNLERLSMRNVVDQGGGIYSIPMSNSALSHLYALEIDRGAIDWSAGEEWTMPNLRVLCIHYNLTKELKTALMDRCLKRLPSLRHLGFQQDGLMHDIKASLDRRLLKRLESLCIEVQCPNQDVRNFCVRELRSDGLSHLKIEFKLMTFVKETMERVCWDEKSWRR